MMYDLLAVGETMILVVPDRPVSITSAETFQLSAAGAESNVAIHLARAGFTVAWAGAVGDDPLGRRVLAAIAAAGVDISAAASITGSPTGVYFKDPGGQGTSVYYYRSGSAASALGAEFARELPWQTARLVHLSGITPALSRGCLELVRRLSALRREQGLPVSFDVNYRPALWPPEVAGTILREIAERCDIVLVGLDEAQVLWGVSDPDGVRAVLPGVGRLVVKDAAHGAIEFRDEQQTFAAALPVEVVEPVGAGDAFAAGYLGGVLLDVGSEECLVRGHRAAAAALTSMHDF